MLSLLAWAALALLMAGPLLAGCSKKAEKDVTTINFVTWQPNRPEVWHEIIDGFEKTYPGIKVRREVGPQSSTAFHDLLTQKLKNKGPDVDVFFMDVTWPPEFASAGWAQSLDDRFTKEERDRFLSGPLAAATYNDKIYGVPLFIDAGLLYYRKDLLDKYGLKPPATWEELVEAAQKVVAGEKQTHPDLTGYSGQFKQYEGLVCNMLELILSNGGWIVDPATGRCALVEEPALAAVRFARDRLIGIIASRGVLTYQEPESLDLFVQGKAVFLRSWPYAWEVSNNPDSSTIAGKVGIATLPHFPGHKSYAALGGWQLGIAATSQHKEAAWKFVRYVTGKETQKLIAVKIGKAPTRTALFDDPEVLAANPQFADMKSVFLAARPRPRTPLYPAVSNILQRYFSNAISNPDLDLEQAAKKASGEVDNLLSMAGTK